VLVVWRLDRLDRSPSHAIEIIGNLLTRGVVVRALAEDLDTSSPESALTVRVLAALAKFQRDSMTRGDRLRLSPNGFRAPARPPPRPAGRPALPSPEQISADRRLIASGDHTVASAARELGLRYTPFGVACAAPCMSRRSAAGVMTMMIDQAPSRFELAAAELRKLGIDLTRLPGEYRVNFHNDSEATARIAETIEAALDLGRAMATERSAAAPNSVGPRHRRRRRMTPKAYHKRLRWLTCGSSAPAPARQSGKEIRHRNAKKPREPVEVAGGDSVNPELVFLDLAVTDTGHLG
jgi:Resolvase, N terminal domain